MHLRGAFGLLTAALAFVITLPVVAPASAMGDPIPTLSASIATTTSTRPTLGDLALEPKPTASIGVGALTVTESGEAAALAARNNAGAPVGTVPTTSSSTTSTTTAPEAESATTTQDSQLVLTKQVELDRVPNDDAPLAMGTDPTVSSEGESGPLEQARSVLELPSLLEASRASDRALILEAVPDDVFACHERASLLPLTNTQGRYEPNLVAQMTHSVFECVAMVGGFGDRAVSWDGGGQWAFSSLAEQVAAEAVVVGYCESVGFRPSALTQNNPWGYGGVFQMGATEMRRFGFAGASKFDPVDNVFAAATYFMYMNRIGGGWGGWGPWAVVNTSFNDAVNDQVRVPVLPRFASTDPSYAGRRGAELPAWAVDPWAYRVPGFDGCPFTGRAWPAAVEMVPEG